MAFHKSTAEVPAVVCLFRLTPYIYVKEQAVAEGQPGFQSGFENSRVDFIKGRAIENQGGVESRPSDHFQLGKGTLRQPGQPA